MSDFWLYFILLALIVILPLAIYAGRLLHQVKQQQIRLAQAEKAALTALKQHDAKIFDSVILICQAMLEQQCELSEGCWRISVLLDSLKTSASHQQQFPSIFELHGKIKHMSILEQRKELPKQQRMKQDFDRIRFEAELQDAILLELETLHQFAKAQKGELAIPVTH